MHELCSVMGGQEGDGEHGQFVNIYVYGKYKWQQGISTHFQALEVVTSQMWVELGLFRSRHLVSSKSGLLVTNNLESRLGRHSQCKPSCTFMPHNSRSPVSALHYSEKELLQHSIKALSPHRTTSHRHSHIPLKAFPVVLQILCSILIQGITCIRFQEEKL